MKIEWPMRGASNSSLVTFNILKVETYLYITFVQL